MRRAPFLLTAAGALILLASIPATGLGHSSAPPVATSRSIMSIAPPAPSPTAVAATQPTEAPQRNAAAAVAAALPSTTVTARISIARIGIRNAPVYDRAVDGKGVMLIAPGYAVTRYAFSASFGSGNTVIYGHDDIQGNIFGHLYDLRPGDTVEIAVAGATQTYHVTGHQIVAPTDVGVLNATSDVRLTIITCWPFNVDTKRWIVTAVAG
ncbi:MAG TPA: sortase [Candidatus Dormibacteraeota bacterium]|nr:sortase [Candidatus Dormibacteraeota bacterium]